MGLIGSARGLHMWRNKPTRHLDLQSVMNFCRRSSIISNSSSNSSSSSRSSILFSRFYSSICSRSSRNNINISNFSSSSSNISSISSNSRNAVWSKLGRRFNNKNSRRFGSQGGPTPPEKENNMRTMYYMTSVAVFVFGLSYASVPLYKLFCQVTGFGGTTQRVTEKQAIDIVPIDGANIITIDFDANVPSTMPWKFYPTQRRIKVVPGETALAFYTAKNPTDEVITGIATYNVHPPKAGLYFSKIQCFCFEEQRLGPKEEVDMPVFFYIDPDFVNDPAMKNCTQITLSYTFFDTNKLNEKSDMSKGTK